MPSSLKFEFSIEDSEVIDVMMTMTVVLVVVIGMMVMVIGMMIRMVGMLMTTMTMKSGGIGRGWGGVMKMKTRMGATLMPVAMQMLRVMCEDCGDGAVPLAKTTVVRMTVKEAYFAENRG